MNSSQLLDFRDVLYIFINSINIHLLNIYYKLGAIIMASLIAQLIKNLQCRRPWVGKIHCRRDRLPTPVFLPGKSHGQRSLAGYSPRGHKEWDTTEHTQNRCYYREQAR